MNRINKGIVLWLIAGCACVSPVYAQQKASSPHIGYVFPAGAMRGSTVNVVVGGQLLTAVNEAVITGTGVHVTYVSYYRPLSRNDVKKLRDKLTEARTKLQGEVAVSTLKNARRLLLSPANIAKEAGVTDAELRALEEYRVRQADPKRQPNPQIEEMVNLKIQVDADAPVGDRQIRLSMPNGDTNPMTFQVGQYPECTEFEPNDRTPDNCIGDVIPVVINGQIMPGDVDKFAFQGKKGMHLVASVAARELIPYLADAVPGWFQSVLTITDDKGHELACTDHMGVNLDPTICVDIPHDGVYVLSIRDSIYRGREDFTYRITLGEVPFITSIFPLGGREGVKTAVQLYGVNLPESRVSPDMEMWTVGEHSISSSKGAVISNRLPFMVDNLPECMETVKHSDRLHAQKLALPMIVNGRIDSPGEADVYRFEGRAGQQIAAEITARRLGSPMDSTLELSDSTGHRIAFNDDSDDVTAGLVTHNADSRILVKLPKTGAYYVTVKDAQSKGGKEFAYRLRVSEPIPDFALRITPSNFSARAGTNVPITVSVYRKDNFAGDIVLALKNPPPGFSLSGGKIPAGQDQVRLTITVPQLRRFEPMLLQMEGIAKADAKEIRRRAVPADSLMQAFAYHHLVPAEQWRITVNGRGQALPILALAPGQPITLPAGGNTTIKLAGVAAGSAGKLTLQLNEPPDGISIKDAANGAIGQEIILEADAKKVKPGIKGNLIVDAYREITVPVTKATPKGGTRKVLIGTLPCVPFEVTK